MNVMRTTVATVVAATLSMSAFSAFAAASLTGAGATFPAPVYAKWADTYCFDTDMIIEACNRTIKAIHQPSFEYADTILANWKNSNVSSLEDVKKADAAYAAGNNIKPKQTASSKPANNRFNNFQQRDKKSDDWYNSLLSNNN